MIFLWILLSTFLISLISLVGIFLFGLKHSVLNRILLLLVGLSAGSFIGGAFFHLLPDSLGKNNNFLIYIYIVIGFCLFFLIEKILHWHHCHKENCNFHGFTYMNLIGDGVHNFIDGLIIAGSFLADVKLGITVSIAILFHEIPQEIADFGVLLHGGFSKAKALFFNFISAVFAVAGALLGYFVSSSFAGYLLPFAAGGFIYIGASDLIPEVHKEKDMKKSNLSFAMFLVGIILMLLIKIMFE